MELQLDFKEGSLITDNSGDFNLVLFKTLYNVVLLKFNYAITRRPYSEFNSYLPLFTWKNYSLTNKDDIASLNNNFSSNDSNNLFNNSSKVYGVEIGSIIDYDYKQMILLGKTDRKVLSFTLERPVLFDFNKAKEKYIVFDRLDKLRELQEEFNANWSEYLITPFASKENIDWSVVRDRLPLEELIGKEFIEKEFAPYPTEQITLDEFYSVINTKKLNQIKDESIKNEIKELIKQTLILAKENNSIGIKSEPKEPTKANKEETRFDVEFTYKLNPSDRDVLTVNEFVYGVDEEDALAKAPNYFYDIYEGKNYDLISVSLLGETDPINAVVPISGVVDKIAGKTLYKINVVVSAMEKDGGRKYPNIYEIYADTETEALENIRRTTREDIKLTDLYYDYDEVVEVIPPTKKEPIIEKSIEEIDNLEDLLAMCPIEEIDNLDDLLALCPIEKTDNPED
jgi:hypothetical protein